MNSIAQLIEAKILQDPGNRGVSVWGKRGDLLPASLSLLEGGHVVISTGFYIPKASAIETDGPPGTLMLAKALIDLGKQVSILTDNHAESIMKSGMESLQLKAELITHPTGTQVQCNGVIRDNTTHFVAIERLGRARDGGYYNHKGDDISSYIALHDDLFEQASKDGIITLGIGDGGNELGLGSIAEDVDKHHGNNDRSISCHTSAEFCICAGVSNWGGYALAAMLSYLSGKNLLPESSNLIPLLNALVDAGAVDGITLANSPTVDGLKQEWELQVYSQLEAIIEPSLQVASSI